MLAVNPTKKELEGIYGHEIANEPVYIQNNTESPTIRIDFITKTDPAQCDGIEIINKASFFLSDEKVYSKEGKIQVIDDFGNSAWAPKEDAELGRKVQYGGKDAKIAPKYRPAFRGEVDLVEFLKAYLGVHDAFNYVNEAWVMKEGNLDDYKFGLDHIKDYFKGDVSELKEVLQLQPKNKVKLLYGVKDGYQNTLVRSGYVLRNESNKLSDIKKNLDSYSGSAKYEACWLKEYVVKEETSSSNNDMPWDL